MRDVLPEVHTLDELYGVMNQGGFNFDSVGGIWSNENYFPGSEETKTEAKMAELRGELATNIPICPFWELVRDCATLAGIDPESLPKSDHYCGRLYPDYSLPGAMTAHGPRPRPYASCQGVATYLATLLRITSAKSPTQEQIKSAHKLPSDERDAVFYKKDRAELARVVRVALAERVRLVTGNRVGIRGGQVEAQIMLLDLVQKAMGSEAISAPFYSFGAKGGCPNAPKGIW